MTHVQYEGRSLCGRKAGGPRGACPWCAAIVWHAVSTIEVMAASSPNERRLENLTWDAMQTNVARSRPASK